MSIYPQKRREGDRPTIPLEDFAAELLAFYAPPLKSANSRRILRTVLEQVARLPGVASVADLSLATVGAWVRTLVDQGLKPNSIQCKLAYLRIACGHAVLWGYLPSNPVEAASRYLPRGYEGRAAADPPGLPSDDQLTRLLIRLLDDSVSWESHRLFALVVAVLYAGLHHNEAIRLEWEHCDFAGLTLRVMTDASGDPVRTIPPTLAEILGQWRTRCGSTWVFPGVRLAGPWNGPIGQRPLERVRAAGQDAGIEGLTLRHLRAAWKDRLGRVSLPEFEGHRPPRRDDVGPRPVRPGPKPAVVAEPKAPRAPRVDRRSWNPVAVAMGADGQPSVMGQPKRLSKAGRRLIAALLEAGREGLSTTQLQLIRGDGRGIVRRLIASDPDWDLVIHRDVVGDRIVRYWIGHPTRPRRTYPRL